MDDAYAIRLAKTQLRDAYERGDVAGVLAVYSDGLGDLSWGLPSFWGPEAKAVLGHRVEKLFARYRAKLAVTVISVRVNGPWAFDWGWHKLVLTPKKGGKRVTKRTRYLEIWRKEADGKWRIVIFLDNPDLAPRMPPKEVLHPGRRARARPRSRRRQG